MFDGLKFYLVDSGADSNDYDQVKAILQNGGARQSSYLTETVSVVIANNCESTEVGEARDIFEIPVVSPRWVILSSKCGRLLPQEQFAPDVKLIFNGFTFLLSELSQSDADNIWLSLCINGAEVTDSTDANVTHVIISDGSNKYPEHPSVKYVTLSWINRCIERRMILNSNGSSPHQITEPYNNAGIAENGTKTLSTMSQHYAQHSSFDQSTFVTPHTFSVPMRHVHQPSSEQEQAAQKEAIQNLVASLKLEVQQLSQQAQQEQIQQIPSHVIQQPSIANIPEPGSPLAPIDPSRLREMVERQRLTPQQMGVQRAGSAGGHQPSQHGSPGFARSESSMSQQLMVQSPHPHTPSPSTPTLQHPPIRTGKPFYADPHSPAAAQQLPLQSSYGLPSVQHAHMGVLNTQRMSVAPQMYPTTVQQQVPVRHQSKSLVMPHVDHSGYNQHAQYRPPNMVHNVQQNALQQMVPLPSPQTHSGLHPVSSPLGSPHSPRSAGFPPSPMLSQQLSQYRPGLGPAPQPSHNYMQQSAIPHPQQRMHYAAPMQPHYQHSPQYSAPVSHYIPQVQPPVSMQHQIPQHVPMHPHYAQMQQQHNAQRMHNVIEYPQQLQSHPQQAMQYIRPGVPNQQMIPSHGQQMPPTSVVASGSGGGLYAINMDPPSQHQMMQSRHSLPNYMQNSQPMGPGPQPPPYPGHVYMQQQQQQQQQQSNYMVMKTQQQTPVVMQSLRTAGGQQMSQPMPCSMIAPTGPCQAPLNMISMPPAPVSQQPEIKRPQFFGHETQVSGDLCLLGCAFLIVDYERLLDQKEVSDWRLSIAQHGGEVESSYSLRVTHCICESLRHPVVQQALKEGKRCVTAQWLNDCLLVKRMQPPWRAMHFPNNFGEHKPCKDKIFTVTGFEGNERQCVKRMILAVGARYLGYLCKKTSVLVAKRMDGLKFEKAYAWSVTVVNVQWLTEVLLGHQGALQNPTLPKYQHYQHMPNSDLFKIDQMILPALMNAWRTPVQFTQETLRSALDRKHRLENDDGKIFPFKKIKLSPSPDESDIAEKCAEKLPAATRPKIIFTGLYQAEVDNLSKKALWLGGELAKTVADCTHIVSSDVKRTLKVLKGIALGKPIVTPHWIRQSYKQSSFLNFKEYIVKDEGNEKFFGFNLKLSLNRARKKKLFANMMYYLTPSIIPSLNIVKEVIEAAGGSVLNQRPPSRKVLELQQKGIHIVVITCDSDMHLCDNLIRRGIPVHSAEFVLTGVLRQEVDYQSYRIETKQITSSSTKL